VKERLVICNEEDTGGRAMVTRAELDSGHFFGADPTRPTRTLTQPDPTQSFYAVPKSKNCNAIFNRLVTNFLQL